VKEKVLLLVLIATMGVFSISFANLYAGIEAGSGGFSIVGGMDTGTSLIELMLSPAGGTISIGGSYAYLMGKIYEGKVGKEGNISVQWGIGGGAYFASAYGYNVFGFGVGPLLAEHLLINNVKLLSTQQLGLTYTPGFMGYGGGIGFGISGGVYYEF